MLIRWQGSDARQVERLVRLLTDLRDRNQTAAQLVRRRENV
jgi:hypothetical protein